MRQRLATLFAITLLTQLWGCGLFKLRDPLSGGPGVPCRTPNTPDDVVANIVERYAEVEGLTCYTEMLDPLFVFHPDTQDSIQALPDTVYVNWNKGVEATVAGKLAANATFHFAAFDSEYADRVVSGDLRHETRFYAYHLIVKASEVALVTSDTLFRGLADVTFEQSGNAQWHVTNWVDRRDVTNSKTWGFLRAVYRSSGD